MKQSIYHEFVMAIPGMRADKSTSRLRAFRTAALPARGAEKTLAPPASRESLQRPTHQLRHEKHFNHIVIPDAHVPPGPGGKDLAAAVMRFEHEGAIE
ncbi:hypothetical protein [Bradyrhizobium sp. USDA 10063]